LEVSILENRPVDIKVVQQY